MYTVKGGLLKLFVLVLNKGCFLRLADFGEMTFFSTSMANSLLKPANIC